MGGHEMLTVWVAAVNNALKFLKAPLDYSAASKLGAIRFTLMRLAFFSACARS
jgi:hypothetical protein